MNEQPRPSEQADNGETDDVRSAIAKVWERSRATVQARIDVIITAADSMQTASVDGQRVTQARTAAHNLAGMLGVFGYSRGSQLAGEIEYLFEAAASPAAATKILDLAQELKAELAEGVGDAATGSGR